MKYVDQELTIEDMLADPIVHHLMRYDGITEADVRKAISQATRKPRFRDATRPRTATTIRQWPAAPAGHLASAG
ncbi:hypothetical protein [Thalassospira sp.]|uniref:hypothetical protein n=1 Tax=Thalassospira sp. TaxID=1912094 RepID=UPI002734B78C|nr:hypothetical protein [Thalassospira sp.]MDP2700172.1 hypothetical protein [Thalassospira sp.]